MILLNNSQTVANSYKLQHYKSIRLLINRMHFEGRN